MRVALFSSTVDARDGYGNITFELTQHLARAGTDITLFLPASQKTVADRLQLPFPVRCVLPEYIYRVYQPRALGYLRTFDLSGFDLVHSLFEFPYCLMALRSARRNHLPFLMGAQGTHGVRPLTFFPERHLVKWCYRQAKAIIVPSDFTKRMIERYAGESYRITVIHNGVNFARFQRETGAMMLREPYGGKVLLLTVGGLWGRKGHDIALRALKRVTEKRQDVRYLIVGEGNARPQLEALVRELQLQSFVEFVGRKSGDDLVRLYQAADIYVHTPKVVDLKFEGFGIVYLEASACGKPIVATDAGGVRDAVLDGETGLIAPDGDIPGVADRLLRLMDDADLRRRMGESGRQYAKKNDWTSIAEGFKSHYRAARA